jgi:hypothetical protein
MNVWNNYLIVPQITYFIELFLPIFIQLDISNRTDLFIAMFWKR